MPNLADTLKRLVNLGRTLIPIAAVAHSVEPSSVVASVAVNVASSYIYDFLNSKHMSDSNSDIAQAIRTASEIHSKPVVAIEALKNWVKSSGWHDVQEALYKDPASFMDSRLWHKFTEGVDFHNPLVSNRELVAKKFLEELNRLICERQGISAIAHQIDSGFKGLSRQITDFTNSVMSNEPRSTNSYENPRLNRLSEQLVELRSMIRNGLFETAADLLKQIRNEIKPEDPKQFHFEVTSAHGNIQMAYGLSNEAADSWCAAFDIEPDTPRALLNKASAALIKNHPEFALSFLTLARQHTLTKEQAENEVILRGMSLFQTNQMDEFDELLKSHPELSSLHVFFAQKQLEKKLTQEARELLKPFIVSDNQNFSVKASIIYGHSVYQEVDRKFQEIGNLAIGVLDHKLIESALLILDEAVQKMRLRQEPLILASIFLLKCALHLRNGDIDQALEANDFAAQAAPELDEPKFNKVLILIRKDQLNAALAYVSDHFATSITDNLALLLGESLTQADRFAEAIPYLTRVSFDPVTPKLFVQRVMLEVEGYLKSNEIELALQTLETAPSEAQSYLPLPWACFHDFTKNFIEADKFYKEALLLPDIQGMMARERYAYSLARQKRFAEALEISCPLRVASAPAAVLLDQLELAMTGTRYDIALTICDWLNNRNIKTERSMYLEAFIFKFQGHFQKAELRLNQLTNLYPDDPFYWLEYAEVLAQNRKLDKAKNVASKIVRLTTATSSILIETAHLLTKLKSHDLAVETIYRAVRSDRNNPDVQHCFMLCMIHLRDPQVKSVAVNTTIFVENTVTGETRIISIVDDPNCDPHRGEIDASSPRGKSLLGLRVGSTIPTKANSLVIPRGSEKIAELKSLFVHEIQNLYANWNEYYPEDNRLQKVSIDFSGDSKLDMLKASLFERKFDVEGVLENIKMGTMPLIVASHFLAISRFEAWANLANHSGLGLFSSEVKIDNPIPRKGLNEAPIKIVLDLSSLVFLAQHKALHVSLDGYQIFVTQLTMDALNIEISNKRAEGYVSLTNDGEIFASSNEREFQRQLQTLAEQVKTFLRTANAQTVPWGGIVNFEPEFLAKMSTSLMYGFLANIAAAKELNAILVTEEGTEGYLANQHNIKHAIGINLIDAAFRNDAKASEIQIDAWKTLLRTKRRYLIPPDKVIMRLQESDGFGFRENTRLLAENFACDGWKLGIVGFQLLTIIRNMAVSNPIVEFRTEFVLSVLTTAWVNKHPDELYRILIRLGSRVFGSILEFQWQEIKSIIDYWYESTDNQTPVVRQSMLYLPA